MTVKHCLSALMALALLTACEGNKIDEPGKDSGNNNNTEQPGGNGGNSGNSGNTGDNGGNSGDQGGQSVLKTVATEVDLGLGVKWATWNLGATKPEGTGAFFAWGETEPYYDADDEVIISVKWKSGKENGYRWENYKWCEGSGTTLTKYYTLPTFGPEPGELVELTREDDAASVLWGGDWRMPTAAELQELMENCDWSFSKVNGVNGALGQSKKKGFTDKSIFLPLTGYRYGTSWDNAVTLGFYWSSSLDLVNQADAYYLGFNSKGLAVKSNIRYQGLCIRPVHP
jgi:hypothetical protein